MALDIGKVGMVMKGNWNSSATYEALDAVSYDNGLYIAKQAVPANTLPTNATYWQVAIAYSVTAYTSYTKPEDSIVVSATPLKVYTWGKIVCVLFSGQVDAVPYGTTGALFNNMPAPLSYVSSSLFTSGKAPKSLPVMITPTGEMATASNNGYDAGWYSGSFMYLAA